MSKYVRATSAAHAISFSRCSKIAVFLCSSVPDEICPFVCPSSQWERAWRVPLPHFRLMDEQTLKLAQLLGAFLLVMLTADLSGSSTVPAVQMEWVRRQGWKAICAPTTLFTAVPNFITKMGLFYWRLEAGRNAILRHLNNVVIYSFSVDFFLSLCY